mgnify:CR=1 FL=1
MNHLVNNYRCERFGDDYFVTTDHGSYCILSEKDLINLKANKIDDSLKKKLLKSQIIIDNSNINEAIELTKSRNHFLFSGTSLHIMVVTLRCNMDCVYCHASSKKEHKKEYDMDKATAKSTVDFIFQSPSNQLTIEFQGGEPVLNWDTLKYIIGYATDKNKGSGKDLRFSLVTNFESMDREKMNYLIDNDVSICTSLDGPKELHNLNRKKLNGSNHKNVIKWVNLFAQEYEKRGSKKRVDSLVTLTRKSLSYPKEIIDEYVKLGLKGIHLRFLDKLGVARKAWPGISYSTEEYMNFWKKAVKYIDELNKKGVEISERMVSLIYNKIASQYDPNYMDMRSPCGAVIGQLAYNYNGDIYTCDEARMIGEDVFVLGNVRESNYRDVAGCENAIDTINASINDQYICDNCAFKPYCGVCPVCNYAYQGSVIGKIPQTDRCKIFKEQFRWVVAERFINKKDNKKYNGKITKAEEKNQFVP